MARFNVEFSKETLEVLEELARRTGTTKADVLRKAVHFEKWLTERSDEGGQLLVKSGEDVREIVKF